MSSAETSELTDIFLGKSLIIIVKKKRPKPEQYRTLCVTFATEVFKPLVDTYCSLFFDNQELLISLH